MATTAQVESARNIAAFRTFVSRMGEEFGPYANEGNGAKIVQRVIELWGGQNLASPDSYEIAFTELLAEGALSKDENYVAPSVKAAIEKLPMGEQSRRYRTDPEFRKIFDLIAQQDAVDGRMDNSNPYQHMTKQQYLSIDPVTRARKYAHELFFQMAVQRLIDRGEL